MEQKEEKARQGPEKVHVCLKAPFTFCHPQLSLVSQTYVYKESVKGFLKCHLPLDVLLQEMHVRIEVLF